MKVISIILILALLNLITACYSTKYVYNNDEIRKVMENNDGIYLQADGREYYFSSPSNYTILHATLTGLGENPNDYSLGLSRDVIIPLDNVKRIGIREFDGDKTTIAVGIATVCAGTIISFYIVLRKSDTEWHLP